MPRDVWRDHPEFLALWQAARANPDEDDRSFVLADWLEENGHLVAAWHERLRPLTDSVPECDLDTASVSVGKVWMGQGAWGRLLTSPPPDEMLCVFDREVMAYQYLVRYEGRCGWNLGQSDWSSPTERDYLRSVPRLEFLACEQLSREGWEWISANLSRLRYLKLDGPVFEPERLADMHRFAQLRGVSLEGTVVDNLWPMQGLPGLRHLRFGPYYSEAKDIAAIAPGLESLYGDLSDLGDEVIWPNLRSLRMEGSRWLALSAKEVTTLALHRRLERLNVNCRDLSASAVKALASLPNLQELTLRLADDKVPSLKSLVKATALESLTIEGAVSEERLAEIVALDRLRFLSIEGLKVERKSLTGLARLQHLEKLSLRGECEDVRPLTAVAKLPNLESLTLKGLTASRKTLEAVKAACPAWVECEIPDSE